MIIRFASSSIFTKGNFPFKDIITLDTDRKILNYYKRKSMVAGYVNYSILLRNVSVIKLEHRQEFFIFSKLSIESTGGRDIFSISGLWPDDARELKYLLDNLR